MIWWALHEPLLLLIPAVNAVLIGPIWLVCRWLDRDYQPAKDEFYIPE